VVQFFSHQVINRTTAIRTTQLGTAIIGHDACVHVSNNKPVADSSRLGRRSWIGTVRISGIGLTGTSTLHPRGRQFLVWAGAVPDPHVDILRSVPESVDEAAAMSETVFPSALHRP
jgi:hypothetical protein